MQALGPIPEGLILPGNSGVSLGLKTRVEITWRGLGFSLSPSKSSLSALEPFMGTWQVTSPPVTVPLSANWHGKYLSTRGLRPKGHRVCQQPDSMPGIQ